MISQMTFDLSSIEWNNLKIHLTQSFLELYQWRVMTIINLCNTFILFRFKFRSKSFVFSLCFWLSSIGNLNEKILKIHHLQKVLLSKNKITYYQCAESFSVIWKKSFVNVYQIKDRCYLLVNLTPSDVFRILHIE